MCLARRLAGPCVRAGLVGCDTDPPNGGMQGATEGLAAEEVFTERF